MREGEQTGFSGMRSMWDRPSGGWFRVVGRAWRPLDNGNTQDAEGFEGLLIDWRETNCFIGAASNTVQPRWLRVQRNRAWARPAGVGLAPEPRARGPLSWPCVRIPSSRQKTRVIRRCRAARRTLSGYPPLRCCVVPGERCARRFVPPIGARRDENLSFSAIFGGVRRSGAMAWGCVPPVSKR